MDVGVYPYPHGDPLLIDKIVNEFLSQGKFDKLRKECLSDADTKPAYQNLQQRVENTVTQFLKKQIWKPDLNKNQLRDSLRKHILESGFFDAGINRIVDQVVNPNLLASVFLPEVEEVYYNYLSIPRPTDKGQKKGPVEEKLKPPGSENESKAPKESEKYEKGGINMDDTKHRDYMDRDVRTPPEPVKLESRTGESGKKAEVKVEEQIKLEPEEVISEETQMETPVPVEKMEVPSEESQDSLSRMGVEGLQISEPEGVPAPDSDDSVPLEINEKSMSESRDSEDSIMNQMSPISQGRLTPDILEEEKPEDRKINEEAKPEEKQVKEVKEEEKKPLTFIGRIPKIKREDSESSKSSKTKEDIPKEKFNVKNVYSSDESDSSKSYGKSDSEEKKSKGRSEKPQSDDRKHKEDAEKSRKHDDHRRSSKDRKKDDRSKDRHSRDRKRERSRERHEVKKSSSSSSSSNARDRSSSHHKSSQSRHRDSKEKSKRKEEEKKKSKSTDDHGKERNKKEDRRSTDRDSNERERDRSSGSRAQGEGRRREREEKAGTTEGKEETRGKEAQVEDEREAVVDGGDPAQVEECLDSDAALDFDELFRSGAVSRLNFPKLTDDFYVKFNSTGFRYFEEWEQAKLDCEEEFKEFVDEAENNLSLISDDETESETEFNFLEENRRTVKNLLRGLGNFRRSLMFDPSTLEFYKWTSTKAYQRFRKKGEKRERRSTEKNESDESIKENIDKNREKEIKALHLKLLNRYRRKAMRMGKPRRRQRRPPESWGIKEKNENRFTAQEDFLFESEVRDVSETETFLGSVKTILEHSLVQSESVESEGVEDALKSLLREKGHAAVTLPESPEESEEWSDTQKKTAMLAPKCSLPLNLPLSPDSDDLNTNGVASKSVTINRKRNHKAVTVGGGAPKKQRRSCSQKYDSQDLYKPRPILNSSRSRGRDRALEPEIVSVGTPVSRPSSLNRK